MSSTRTRYLSRSYQETSQRAIVERRRSWLLSLGSNLGDFLGSLQEDRRRVIRILSQRVRRPCAKLDLPIAAKVVDLGRALLVASLKLDFEPRDLLAEKGFVIAHLPEPSSRRSASASLRSASRTSSEIF